MVKELLSGQRKKRPPWSVVTRNNSNDHSSLAHDCEIAPAIVMLILEPM